MSAERLAITLKRISTNTAIFYNVSVKDLTDNVLFHSRKPLSPEEALMVILTEFMGMHGVQVQSSKDGEWLTIDDVRRAVLECGRPSSST